MFWFLGVLDKFYENFLNFTPLWENFDTFFLIILVKNNFNFVESFENENFWQQ